MQLSNQEIDIEIRLFHYPFNPYVGEIASDAETSGMLTSNPVAIAIAVGRYSTRRGIRSHVMCVDGPTGPRGAMRATLFIKSIIKIAQYRTKNILLLFRKA
jgi:hypothetical protein